MKKLTSTQYHISGLVVGILLLAGSFTFGFNAGMGAMDEYIFGLQDEVVHLQEVVAEAPDLQVLSRSVIELELLKGARLKATDMTIVVPMMIGMEVDVISEVFNQLLEEEIIKGYSWVEEHPVWSRYHNALPIRVHGINTTKLLDQLTGKLLIDE